VRTLVDLLGDDSQAVLKGVTRELAASGKSALPALRKAAKDPNALRRTRARKLLARFERARVYRRLLSYATRSELDLETGLFLLARLDREPFDARPYKKALDAMASKVLEQAGNETGSFARPMALSQYLGNDLGFLGSEIDFDHPNHVHLHRAIESKRGMPLTLTAIYMFVARRADFKVAPIALPGRIFLRLYLGERTMILDPFDGGRARTRSDCIRYLALHGLVPRPEWFRDATDAALLQRHILNLMQSFQVRGLNRDARALHRIAVAMNAVHASSLVANPPIEDGDAGKGATQ